MNPHRKNLRLQGYDYSAPGCYFVTLCTQEKRCILSEIIPALKTEHPQVRLTGLGKIVAELLVEQAETCGMRILASAVMPNHVHILLESDGRVPVGQYVGSVKSLAYNRGRKEIGNTVPYKLWQRNYYDHVIRNQQDLLEKWKYIEENLDKWLLGEGE